MAYALIANVSTGGTANSCTTSSIDTTGANLLVVCLVDFVAGGAPSITDSKGNTYTALTATNGATVRYIIYYNFGGTVGSGHTFTNTSTGSFSSICALAFSGGVTSPFDQQNGATGGTITSLSTGSVTPGFNNEILVTGIGFNGAVSTPTIGSSFIIPTGAEVTFGSGAHFAASCAYKIQTTAGAENPAWAFSSVGDAATRIATFKSPAVTGSLFGRSSLDGLSTSGPNQFTRIS